MAAAARPCPAHLTGIRARAEPGRGITGLEGGRKAHGRLQRLINMESDMREQNPGWRNLTKASQEKTPRNHIPPAPLVSERVVPEGDSYQSSAERGKGRWMPLFWEVCRKGESPASCQARFQVGLGKDPGSSYTFPGCSGRAPGSEEAQGGVPRWHTS